MIDKFFEMLGNLYLKLVFKRFIDNKDVENEFIKYGFRRYPFSSANQCRAPLLNISHLPT